METLTDKDFERICEETLGDNCFFMEIGANNGITYDPLYPLLLRHNWYGIYIEPGDDAFNELVNNFRNRPNMIFEKCVISEITGEKELICGPTSIHFSMVRNYADFMFGGAPETIKTVKSYTSEDMLKKHNINKVDLLIIDTEGYDYIVLKYFPFHITKPKIVRAEFIHTGFCTTEIGVSYDMVKILEDNGYVCYNDESSTEIIGILKEN